MVFPSVMMSLISRKTHGNCLAMHFMVSNVIAFSKVSNTDTGLFFFIRQASRYIASRLSLLLYYFKCPLFLSLPPVLGLPFGQQMVL